MPQIFTDEFDYLTRDDFVRGILVNEEVKFTLRICLCDFACGTLMAAVAIEICVTHLLATLQAR